VSDFSISERNVQASARELQREKDKENESKRKRSCVSPMKDLFLLTPHNSVYTLTIHVCLMGSFVLGELGKFTKLQWLDPQSRESLISDPL